MRPRFLKNNYGLSIMYDAVLFIVMVSLSGAVLIPALTSDVAVTTSIQKHREETADEALLMLMTSRVDSFDYIFAGSQIDNIASTAGVDVNDEDGLYNSITSQLLGREMTHKTYADLCVENIVTQIKILEYRINIFTEQYDQSIDEKISTLLNYYLGGRYNFNLSIKWHPMVDLPFGGQLFVGSKPPETDTHVSKSFITIPSNFFTNWFDDFQKYFNYNLETVRQNYEMYKIHDVTAEEFKQTIFDMLNTTYNNVFFNGFKINGKECNGLINKSIDFLFDKVQGSLSNILGNTMNQISEFLDVFEATLGFELDTFLIEQITSLTGFELIDVNHNGMIDFFDIVLCLKRYTTDVAKSFLEDKIQLQINSFIEGILLDLGFYEDTSFEDIELLCNDFFNKRMNPLRAEFRLTIWEVFS